MQQMAGTARDQILNTAGRLFFRSGYRAVGVDTIIAESGVAKATLYRYFASKDELIAAYLEEMDRLFWAWFNGAAGTADNPRDQMKAVFAALEILTSSPACYGCPFLIAATEFPDAEHPGHQIAIRNKGSVRSRLRALSAEAGARDPELLGDQLLLLMDGAFMAVRLFGVHNTAERVGTMASHAIDAACP